MSVRTNFPQIRPRPAPSSGDVAGCVRMGELTARNPGGAVRTAAPVTAARLDRRGNIVLELSYAEG
ncbi:hypothetical protein ACIA5D_27490 [Actinoplanes sp. NPDC051513]|uniref:hypothetical protein n=1 Tax=Actinoplanes sp. NPDC051513 TaxID=3363908 RepID=UPI00378C596C